MPTVQSKRETRNSRDAEDEIASTFSGINNVLNRKYVGDGQLAIYPNLTHWFSTRIDSFRVVWHRI